MGRATGDDWFTRMDKELRFIQKKDRLISNVNNVLLQEVSTLVYYYDVTMDSYKHPSRT